MRRDRSRDRVNDGNQDYRRNWILVDSTVSSRHNPYERDRQVYATPSLGDPSTSRASILSSRQRDRDPESRIHSINRLNDRIQRRLAAQYNNPIYANSPTILEESERPRDSREVEVDVGPSTIHPSSHYTHNQQRLVEQRRDSSAEARLDRLIQHRNSQGEIDAVYEKRPIEGTRFGRPSQLGVGAGGRRRAQSARSSRQLPNRTSPAITQRELHARSRLSHIRAESTPSIVRPQRAPPADRQRHLSPSPQRRRRADSVDSGSLRLSREQLHSGNRWQIAGGSSENLLDQVVGDRGRPPTTLRRAPQYYSSCDVCAYKTLRPGEFCPFCARGAYPPPQASKQYYQRQQQRMDYRDYPPRRINYNRAPPPPPPPAMFQPDPYYPQVQILSARSLQRSAPYLNVRPHMMEMKAPRRPLTRYTDRKVYPPAMSWKYRPPVWDQPVNAWHHEPQLPPRRIRSPVFRYGRSLPEELYDYDVHARESERRLRQRKALALAVALLAFALVVSAGVVLAAIHY
ncbi:unnamed protein product, partial [Mesorhabditis belari]|uniref:Uncharacterized protein n=1 Tax=Mesorhabditis belari TaxID=2138241 RepID=A0AAF3ENX5_9BILA